VIGWVFDIGKPYVGNRPARKPVATGTVQQ